MIYLDKLNEKLNSILNKNVAELTAQHGYIPTLGTDYTQAQLQAWLDKRSNLLNTVKINNYSDAQIANFIQNIRNTLSAADRLTADGIIDDTIHGFKASDEANYEKLALILFYHFVTTP